MNSIKGSYPKKVGSIWCSGETGIYQSGKLIEVRDIRVECEFFIDLISIDLFTDIWMPVDFDIQKKTIEDAEISSLRLESFLRTIKSNGIKVNPDEGDIYQEYVAKQIGFRMYYPLARGYYQKTTKKVSARFHLVSRIESASGSSRPTIAP